MRKACGGRPKHQETQCPALERCWWQKLRFPQSRTHPDKINKVGKTSTVPPRRNASHLIYFNYENSLYTCGKRFLQEPPARPRLQIIIVSSFSNARTQLTSSTIGPISCRMRLTSGMTTLTSSFPVMGALRTAETGAGDTRWGCGWCCVRVRNGAIRGESQLSHSSQRGGQPL